METNKKYISPSDLYYAWRLENETNVLTLIYVRQVSVKDFPKCCSESVFFLFELSDWTKPDSLLLPLVFYRLFTLFISKSISCFLCVLRLTLALLLALHLSWLIICWHPLAANETAKLSRRASGCCVIPSVLCSGSSTVCSECVYNYRHHL